MRKSSRGFTLIELMIVVALIAILAAVAGSVYTGYVQSSALSAAQTSLLQLANQVDQYAQDHDTYVGACTSLPSVDKFVLSCPQLSTNQYVLLAQGTGDLAGLSFTLDSAGAKATPSAPAGWVPNASCWIADKSGACVKGS